MRVVLDTNTTVSGFLWGGKPGQMLELAREGWIRVFTTAELVAEREDVLRRPKLSPALVTKRVSIENVMSKWRVMTEVVQAVRGISAVQADPDDDEVLACAAAALCDLIISGDKHLLDIKQYGNARIVNAAEAVMICDAHRSG